MKCDELGYSPPIQHVGGQNSSVCKQKQGSSRNTNPNNLFSVSPKYPLKKRSDNHLTRDACSPSKVYNELADMLDSLMMLDYIHKHQYVKLNLHVFPFPSLWTSYMQHLEITFISFEGLGCVLHRLISTEYSWGFEWQALYICALLTAFICMFQL